MLSYRHAFHAGNHADVLKHLVEVQILDYLGQKGAFWYIDTHAGAGAYSLTEGYATKTAEYVDGVARLWQREDAPAAVQRYLEVVRGMNQDGELRHYPGSPWFAAEVMAGSEKLRLFELHPSDFDLLSHCFADAGRRVKVEKANGFEAIKSILPPPPRRALTLIDPPYEDKGDYQHVVRAMKEALKRFATGCYAIWYPLLQRKDVGDMLRELKKLPCHSWLDVSLTVRKPSQDGFGMHGSGMFVVNPPWTLKAELESVLPWLTDALAVDAGASYDLAFHENGHQKQ